MALDGQPIASEDRPWDEQGADRWERWAWVLVVALVAVVFARTVRFGLFQDDNVLARPWTGAEVLGAFHGPFDPTNYITAYFRPLSSVSFALDWTLWGTNLWGYHLVNMALHAIASVCVWALLRRVRVPRWAALVGASFFVLVPANVATAVYIAERTDAMVAIAICLGMLSLFRFHRTGRVRWLVWMNLAYVVGLLAKEEATAIVPFAMAFWLYLQLERTPPHDASTGIRDHWMHETRLIGRAITGREGRGAWLRVVGPLAAVTVVYLGYRGIVMPAGSLGNRFGETQNPVRALIGGLDSVVKGVPWEIRALPQLPVIVAFVVGFALRPRARAWRVVLLGFAFALGGVLPLSFSGGVEPRLLYVAEIGLATAIAGLVTVYAEAIARARDSGRNLVAVAALVTLVSLVVVAALGVSQIAAQNVFRPGASLPLAKELVLWQDEPALARVPAENVRRIREHLLEAGLIDDQGRPVGEGPTGD
jgi:hypothetical protein